MAGAVATLLAMRVSDTVVRHNDGKTNVYCRLFFFRDRANGAGGADLAAASTLGAAETAFEGHLRLHERLQFVGGAENVVGALSDTELATRAAG
jgi:hypothetical protein